MVSGADVIGLLNHILDAPHSERVELVKKVQHIIWNDEAIQDDRLNDILSELAYDLDFYEPNQEWKKEVPNYFDDEQLEQLLRQAIQKIASYGTN